MSILKDHISALRNGEYSAEELCRSYLSKIEAEDSLYNAFLHVDLEGALNAARQADEMLRSGNAPLLCGIPFALKDNICSKGIPTTAASKILESFVPPYDATAASLLKDSGAVLLGKTNMDEFAMGSDTKSSAYKITKNPKNTDMTPGGSSGGSAAAVAAGFVPFALGSDTGGSVRQPASFCGCVGLAPTYGTVSRYGLIAFASSLDRIGILAPSCADCKVILPAIAKKDRFDSTSRGLSALDAPESLKGLRIGIAEEFFSDNVNDEVKARVMEAAEVLCSLGATFVSISLPSLEYATEAYYIISSAEASSNLARYDGVRFGSRSDSPFSSIDEFYKNNRSEGLGKEAKRRIMLGTFVLSEGSYDDYYKKALSVRELVREDYRKAFEKCDIILSPTAPETASPINGEPRTPASVYSEDFSTVSQSLAGLPAISVPCGTDRNGLPVGMQLTGPAFSEGLLIFVGECYEEVTK